jgi:hypothetical protein
MSGAKGQEVFKRVENKYLITQEQYTGIVNGIHDRMTLDSYAKKDGTYQIMSLYYDTPCNELIRMSQTRPKPKYKEKLRFRTYGVPTIEQKVWVEIKKKFNGMGNKRRCLLPLADAYRLLENGQVENPVSANHQQILSEIQAMLRRHEKGLCPAILISYDRVAYNGKEDAGLRVTFDTNLLKRTEDLRMESGVHGEPILLPGFIIMEVKALGSLPLWLSRLLSSQSVFPRGFSKYATAYNKKLAQELRELDLDYGEDDDYDYEEYSEYEEMTYA